jgi:hypothetical protein
VPVFVGNVRVHAEIVLLLGAIVVDTPLPAPFAKSSVPVVVALMPKVAAPFTCSAVLGDVVPMPTFPPWKVAA